MKTIAAVAREELIDNALLFPAALLAGSILPVVLALRSSASASDVGPAAAAIMGLIVGGVLAAIFGFRSTAGDFASRRVAFYFARPITAFQLWFGKAAGAMLVACGCAAFAFIPTLLAELLRGRRGISPASALSFPLRDPALAGVAAASVAVVYLAAQGAGLAAWVRSPRLAIEAVLGAGAVVAAAELHQRLRRVDADGPADAAVVLLAVAAITALAVGCYRAVREGRTDAPAADRARARAFWGIVGIAMVAAAAFGVWVMTPGPSDLRGVFWVAPAPSGDWMAVSGTARWRDPVFLDDLRTRKWIRTSAFWATTPVISADGSAAAWITRGPGLPEPVFTARALGLSDERRREVAFESKDLHEPPLLVFSPDARRLAIVSSGRIEVWDRDSGRLLAAARPPSPLWENGRGFSCATFADSDTLRVYAVRPSPPPARESTIDIFALDVAARRIAKTGTAGPFARTFPILADGARRRLLVRDTPASVVLLDARGGAVVRRFEGGGAVSRSAEFLSDGRVAVFEGGAAARLRVVSADGSADAEIPLGPGERAFLLGEISPGRAILDVGSRTDFMGLAGPILVVDLAARSVERWADRLSPAAPYASTIAGDPGNTPAPGSLGTRLFFTADRRLVELTGPGRTRTLFPAR